MSTSETPRTDGMEYVEGEEQISVVESHFARTLECELAEAQDRAETAEAELAALRAEVERLTKDHEQACCLVAKMHEAAMGRVCGPVLGPVEDVAQLCAEVAELREDKARLDWLLARGVCWRGCNAELMGEGWAVGHETEWLYDVKGQGRARIDKGIQARKEGA